MTLDITRTSADGVVTLALAGELDLATKDDFTDALDGVATDATPRVLVDLERLTFLDSTGIGLLVRAATTARDKGGWVRIRQANGSPLRALQITGVIALLDGSVTSEDGATT